jgi:hypothetical protein
VSSAAGRSTPGLTGFACVWLFRRDLLGSVRALLLRGILPGLGGPRVLGPA